MNESFFHLPDDKRTAIINAALRTFSQYGYKKSPMNEIAGKAGISKSLLFYYFKNKKELYMYLAEYCAEVNKQEMLRNGCYEKCGFFEVLTSGLKVKADLMRHYPEIALFELRGYFENSPEMKDDIMKLIGSYSQFEVQKNMMRFDPAEFVDGINLEMMYRNIYLAAEGYLWEFLNHGKPDPDKMEREYMQMIDHWKQIYLRKGAAL